MKNKLSTSMIVATLFLYVLSYFFIKDLTFFVSDIGLRYLQIQQLIEHQWQTFAIDYPVRFLDPTLEHISYYNAYGILDGEIYFLISPFFPLLVSYCYALLGKAGLPIIPVLSTVMTAWATYKLAEASELPNPWLAFWGTIFATPFLFYSFVLWDHTLAGALTLWAVYGVIKGMQQQQLRPLFAAGIAIGVGINQRPEVYTFAIALGISCLILSMPKWENPLTLALGGVVGAIPLWILQYFWVGHPLGLVMASKLFDYSLPSEYPSSQVAIGLSPQINKSRFLVYLQEGATLTYIIAILILVGSVVIVLALRSAKQRQRTLLLIGFALSGIGYILTCFISLFGPIRGIFSSFPLIPLSLSYINSAENQQAKREIYQLIFFTSWLFLFLMVVIWPSSGGLQWASRYLLMAYPLLLYLALHVYVTYSQRLQGVDKLRFRYIAFTLLALTLALQIISIYLLYNSRIEEMATKTFVSALEADIILTNVRHASSFLASVENKQFLFVKDEQDLAGVLEVIAENEISLVAIILKEDQMFAIPERVGDISVEQIDDYVYELSIGN